MASLPVVGVPAYPTPSELRNSMLRTCQFAYAQVGLVANIQPKSDLYIRFDALSKRLSIALANNQIARTDYSPLTATGAYLLLLLQVFGVPERQAESATGYLSVKTTAACSIPAGYQGTGPTGAKYVTTGITQGAVTGTLVQVRAVEPGTAGNLAAGQTVTWDSSQVGQLLQTATVGVGGIDGGADVDNEETKRQRLINRIAFPAGGGNRNQIRTFAEDASAAVKTAFVYAAARGPGSYDVAVIGSSGDGILTSATLSPIGARVLAQMPGHASLNLTSVANQYVDVVISLQLPMPISAGGSGGGWKDNAPWPQEDVLITFYAPSIGNARCHSTVAPPVGATIGLWDPSTTNADGTTGLMREYTVIGPVTGVVGNWGFYVISTAKGTTNAGFGFDPTGCWISAGCVNLTLYAKAIAAKIALLGPGEKSTSPDILPGALRHPSIDIEAPNGLTNRLLDAVDGTFLEVEDIAYTARFKTGTPTTILSPDVPATTADPPNRLALKFLAFRRA